MPRNPGVPFCERRRQPNGVHPLSHLAPHPVSCRRTGPIPRLTLWPLCRAPTPFPIMSLKLSSCSSQRYENGLPVHAPTGKSVHVCLHCDQEADKYSTGFGCSSGWPDACYVLISECTKNFQQIPHLHVQFLHSSQASSHRVTPLVQPGRTWPVSCLRSISGLHICSIAQGR